MLPLLMPPLMPPLAPPTPAARHLHAGDCTTANLVYPSTSARRPSDRPLNILLFGDSVDGCLMNAWCGYVKNSTHQEVDQWPLFKWHDRTKMSYCQTKASAGRPLAGAAAAAAAAAAIGGGVG
jgi:hypothetical protein